MARHPARVLVVGGGVAAIELMLALDHLAREHVEMELLAPDGEFTYRPLAVAEPFQLGEVLRFDLGEIAAAHGVEHRADALASVDVEHRRVRTESGEEVPYDALALAIGARPTEALPGAMTFAREGDTTPFRELLDELERGIVRTVAFAVPSGTAWTLPLYELALMTGTFVERKSISDARLAVVTPEVSALHIFGGEASRAVSALLAERDIEVHTRQSPIRVDGRTLIVAHDGAHDADRVFSLPRLVGPGVSGLPQDSQGFVPTDRYGRVQGANDVYAAGDATTFPIKQGGLATQQADVVAGSIAAWAGAPVTPEPFQPVLRGLLLTGRTPSHLRRDLRGSPDDDSRADVEPLWWPPSKIAGRYLSPYIARLTAAAHPEPGFGLRIEVDDIEDLMG